MIQWTFRQTLQKDHLRVFEIIKLLQSVNLRCFFLNVIQAQSNGVTTQLFQESCCISSSWQFGFVDLCIALSIVVLGNVRNT